MSIGTEWLNAFPIRPATEAVDALCESWEQLARRRLPGFHPGMKEPDLTRVLKAHVESVTARNRGLLGMWAAESVINVLDPVTAVIREERRNDIVYGWNDETVGLQLVFEFKKMSCSARDRRHYLGPKGMERFVTGIYSRNQAVAAMVGMLLEPANKVVPPLRVELSKRAVIARLRLRRFANGATVDRPSILFTQADFDTEHHRDPSLAPSHGTIRVAHMFLAFAYAASQQSGKARRKRAKAQRSSVSLKSSGKVKN